MKRFALISLALLVMLVLYISARHDYLLFHCLSEVYAIIIACGTFMVAWNARRYLDNQYLLVIGIAYLFIGVLDLAHTLSYKGMNILPGLDANAPTQLWIAARYMQSLTLLAAPLMRPRRIRPGFFIAGYGVLTLLVLVSIFYGHGFPDCFREGAGGLTPFKKNSEYLICLILLAGGAVIHHQRHQFDPAVLRWMLACIGITILSEFAFTTYASVYGAANMLGHYLKIVAFYCVYKAIIETTLAKPYEALFRDLKQSKERYHSLFIHMIDGFANHQMVYDAEGRPVDYIFLEVNSAFEALTGLTGIVGKRATEVLPGIENDAADWIGVYGRVATTGNSARFESYSEKLNKWYSIIAYSPYSGQFATVFEDISLRRQAQEALRLSAARFKLLSDTTGLLLTTENPQGLVQELCGAVMRHLNCQTFFNFLVDEGSGRLHLNAYAGIPEEQARKIEWLDFGVAVCGCVARDQQRIIAEDIGHSSDLRTELIKSYGIQAYCCHPLMVQGRLIGTLSFGTRTRPHFTPEEVEMMRTVSFKVALAMQRIEITRSLQEANEVLERKVQDRTAALAHTIETLQKEIAGRKRAENELRQANRQLAARAHQLRALTGELTMAEQRERKRLSKVLHDGLQQHLAIAKLHLSSMSGQMGSVEFKKMIADIETMITESIQMSRSLSAELSPPILYERGLAAGLEWLARWVRDKHGFRVALTTEPIEEPPEDVNVLIFESVRELLFNAVKHARAPWALVHLQSMDGAGVRITISDEGVGFDVGTLKPAGDLGGGFGLFSIQERIGLVGGSLVIESAPGQGSRFSINVPYPQCPAAPICPEVLPGLNDACHVAGAAPAEKSTAAIRVLIADDHALYRDGLVRLVNREPDLEVVGQAHDGRQAVALSHKLRPDVILMDINMPNLSGIEATHCIHQEQPWIRIIGLSMHEDPDHAQAMRSAGAVAYKNKGCAAAEIVAAIRSFTESSRGLPAGWPSSRN